MINLLAATADSSPFALVQGLPVHPLVVHAAVVFVPLTALGLILMALIPKFAAKLGWLVTLTGAVALGTSFVAKESGEQLEKLVGEPGFDHAEYGDRMPVIAGVLFVVTLVLWLLRRKGSGGVFGLLVSILGLIVAAGSLFAIYQVGDSGARSVWEGEVSADASAPTPTETPSAQPSASATTGAITAADVATHNTPDDCWTSINGTVYNVTAWIDQHPGGAQRIINLCGTDGTSAFDGQHEGEPKPETILAGFEVGTLS